MEVLFATADLADLCSAEHRLIAELGDDLARVVGVRLHEIEAAVTLGDLRLLPHLRVHADAAHSGRVSVDLIPPRRLLLRPVRRPLQESRIPTLDWLETESVVVERIIGARPVKQPGRRRAS